MRAVNTCDFCSEPAVGVFEIVPESLEPSEREQRRTALCESCQHRLETLLEPLLERAKGGSRASMATGAVDSNRSPSLESNQETGSGGLVDGSDESESENERDPGGSERGKPSTSLNDEPGGVLLEPDSDSSDDSSAAEENEADAAEANDVNRQGSSDEPVSPETDSSTADNVATDPDTPPRAYGKVRRLLRNREFPMARADVEGLAAGAYDLERHEVDAIIEYAIEQGELVESGGKLRRA